MAQVGACSSWRLVPQSAAERACSLNPADYVYAANISSDALRRLQQSAGAGQGQGQPCGAAHAPGGAGSEAAGLRGAAPHAGGDAKGQPGQFPLADELFGAHLDLDDDCLRLLLGEDADESGPCASAAGSGKGPAGSASGAPKGQPGSGGASQKSSATADQAGAGAADGEAASLPAGGAEAGQAAGTAAAAAAGGAGGAAAHKEEDDDIAMLFGEYRGAANMEPLDLHLLSAPHHTHPLPPPAAPTHAANNSASPDDDTASAAGGAADSPTKRAKPSGGAPAAPAASGGLGGLGLNLTLSMDYDKAAASINLELLGGHLHRKAGTVSDGFDSMPPLLSPVLDFGSLGGGSPCPGVDTPESPDSLASGSDTVAPMPPLGVQCQDSTGKRKRAVRQ